MRTLPALLVAALALPSRLAPAQVTVSEVWVGPEGMIEIAGSPGEPLVLDDLYLTNRPDAFHLVDTSPPAGEPEDFLVRFPEGTWIDPDQYLTIALGSTNAFLDRFGDEPDFLLSAQSDAIPVLAEPYPGASGAGPGLETEGMLWLFAWDQTSDLVVDHDYLRWGEEAAALDRSGIAVDGPDGDSEPTFYLDDTPAIDQSSAQVQQDRGLVRIGSGEWPSPGNGVDGSDQTAEPFEDTFRNTLTATPGLENLATYELTGQVSLPDDFGPLGVLVQVRDTGLHSVTDPDGLFEFSPFPRCAFEILTSRADLLDRELSGEIDDQDIHLEVEMEPAAILEGFVALENGMETREGSLVTALDTTARTDGDGWYTLILPDSGETEVRFSREGYEVVAVTLDIRGIDRFDVELQAAGQYDLAGIVTDGNEPIEEALAVLEGAELLGPLERRTNHIGRFIFEQLAPGWYRLVVTAEGMSPVRIEPLSLFGQVDLVVALDHQEPVWGPSCHQENHLETNPGSQALVWLLVTAMLACVIPWRRTPQKGSQRPWRGSMNGRENPG